MIAQKLREHYNSVCQSRQLNNEKLHQTQTDINQISLELEDMKAKAPLAAEKFKFYQELRGYVTDLVECLDEKLQNITDIEQRALDQLSKRSTWLVERRRQDVRDQAEEATKANTAKKLPEDEDKIRRAAEREGRRTRRRRAREIGGQIGGVSFRLSKGKEM